MNKKISALSTKAVPALADYTVIVDVAGGGVNKRSTLAQILALVQALPAGGTIGQILTKLSSTDGDATWEDPAPAGQWGLITGNILDQTDLIDELTDLADAIDAVVEDIAYDAGTWNANTKAPSKNAIRDWIEGALTTALNLLAPKASPTFTGTVSGITAAMVGLGNADNTSDANKPVSTAQQTALNLKANLAGPTFTGVASGDTAAPGTNTNQFATTAFVAAAVAGAFAIYRPVGVFTTTSVTPTSGALDETFVYTGSSAQTFSTTGFGTIASLTNGYRVTLIGSDDTNTITINESDITNGRLMNGSVELGKGKAITFEYNSTLARMVEVNRNF